MKRLLIRAGVYTVFLLVSMVLLLKINFIYGVFFFGIGLPTIKTIFAEMDRRRIAKEEMDYLARRIAEENQRVKNDN